MSQEFKKARLRQIAQEFQESQKSAFKLDICLKCHNPCDECGCGVSIGKLMTVKEWKRRKEGLGAVRD